MKKIQIKGYATLLPKKIVKFQSGERYKIGEDETQLDIAVRVTKKAIENANISIEDVDCIVGACAVGVQPIPCTAALVHEKIAKGTSIPTLDINTTCTSFITALDIMSFLIEGQRYKRVLIFSVDVPSIAVNPNQKESYELFSDGAAAVIIEYSENGSGIIDGIQKTWSEGVHFTEIRGGLSNIHPKYYNDLNKEEFMFDMNGKGVLKISKKNIVKMLDEFLEKNSIKKSDIDMVIPHQASLAMPLVMEKLGFEKEKYINIFEKYGNMVSASVPMTLCYALENKKIKKGDTILLIGTAAGLTTNMLLMKI